MTDSTTANEPGERQDPPGVDVRGLAQWLATEHPELLDSADAPLDVRLIAGGRSNLTYRVDGAARPLVLRRPPLGHVLASAHDMFREHRVISALAGTGVPVPPVVDVVDDTETQLVTGTPFFVMEFVEGRVLASRTQNAAFSPAGLARLGANLAETLADLHAVDPAAVGLESFGKPEGYLARQMSTWHRQYEASRSRELPELDRLLEALGDRLPENPRTGIVHGDYRLDNAIVAGEGDEPRIVAVLDWEMATLGDPLVDLGMLGLYWGIADLPGGRAIAPSAVDVEAGHPTFDALVAAYAARAGIDVPDLSWYRAFAAAKLAVILEGIHLRFTAGKTVGAGYEHVSALVVPLANEGLAQLGAAVR
ncbi:phosphotransferase family protein [Agromyces protaetiae]|uniref:Phosphotransferase family protein n=1 Tax=Agromyces protaetiae TaxID=2509455 RepID=A0A4P6FCU9_9MICO|nr:phosphotransferase family protein [Agromyces protaetiae]QAY72179.1 phosphotransferase family protein [Agromyces protaetiae]